MRPLFLAPLLILITSVITISAVEVDISLNKEPMTKESKEHPRIHESMIKLRETIKELEAAPSDFGGHKAEALEACRKAYHQLRLALGYRAEVDEKK